MSIIIKTEEQIEGIRQSCQLAADCICHIEGFVRPGVSTETIDKEIEKYIRDFGGIPAPLGYRGFPKASCTSLNEVVCHGIPKSEDVLKDGDIIKIDVSTILKGYYGDTCWTFPVGRISEENNKLLSVTKDCLSIGIAQVRPDNMFGNIGRAISSYARSRGFSVVYQFVGHGVGLNFHEAPQINHDDRYFDNTKMKPGMIFTIEPMINEGIPETVVDNVDKWTARTKDGKMSAQFEHTILVTEKGAEVLTK